MECPCQGWNRKWDKIKSLHFKENIQILTSTLELHAEVEPCLVVFEGVPA